jgi:hypothetical protein
MAAPLLNGVLGLPNLNPKRDAIAGENAVKRLTNSGDVTWRRSRSFHNKAIALLGMKAIAQC